MRVGSYPQKAKLVQLRVHVHFIQPDSLQRHHPLASMKPLDDHLDYSGLVVPLALEEMIPVTAGMTLTFQTELLRRAYRRSCLPEIFRNMSTGVKTHRMTRLAHLILMCMCGLSSPGKKSESSHHHTFFAHMHIQCIDIDLYMLYPGLDAPTVAINHNPHSHDHRAGPHTLLPLDGSLVSTVTRSGSNSSLRTANLDWYSSNPM